MLPILSITPSSINQYAVYDLHNFLYSLIKSICNNYTTTKSHQNSPAVKDQHPSQKITSTNSSIHHPYMPIFYVQSLPDPLYKKIVDVIKDIQDISQICMKLQHLGGENFSKSILSIHKPAIAKPFFVKRQCVTP